MSVPIQTHKTRTVVKGNGTRKIIKAKKGINSAVLAVNAYAITFLKLSNILLPS